MAGGRDKTQRILADNMNASEVVPALDVLASARMAGGGMAQ
jgi:hypothetical protein